jgi:hypothetical protein
MVLELLCGVVYMILKVFMTLEVDEDDYQVPVDRLVDSEVSAALEEYIYDIDGLTVQTIKILTE